jgi:outer membrane protein assembly factor BamB
VVDVFDEVEEQLRSDRYKTLALKALPWIGAATVAVVIGVGGYWGWTTYQTKEAAKASDSYQAALEVMGREGVRPRASRPCRRSPRAARTATRPGPDAHGRHPPRRGQDQAEAVGYFDEAAKLSSDPVIGDLARLKSAFALMDTASFKDIEARLTPLAGEKSPYRVKAKEALAFAKLQAGDTKGAREDFSVLANLLDNSSDEVRQRAQAAMQMIDAGSAKDLAAVVKASIALPPAADDAGAPATRAERRPMSRSMISKRSVALIALMSATMTVSGCSTISKINPFDKSDKNKSKATQGQRISVIAFDQKVETSESLKGADFYLPEPATQTEWRLPGGNAEQSSSMSTPPRRSRSPGARASAKKGGKFHITAPPVASADRIFVMDGEADRRGARRQDGLDRLAQGPASGGRSGRQARHVRFLRRQEERPPGLRRRRRAGPDNKLYVSRASVSWRNWTPRPAPRAGRQTTATPIHAAPTVVDGRVFVVSTDNELLTYAAATGAPGWTYQALIEPARILGASSPAVSGDTVVAGFASGELVALRAANGNDLWSEALSRASRTNALSEIRDIPGRPVIYKGDVFAVSHSGVFAATDLRTGQARWSLPVTGITTPGPPATSSMWSTRPAR